MADPICRWCNPTPKNIARLLNCLPLHFNGTESEFKEIVNLNWSAFENGDFFTTPYQLATQIGLYKLTKSGYERIKYIDPIDFNNYMSNWLENYYTPNPYTPSFPKEVQPINLHHALCSIAKNKETPIKNALKSIFENIDIGNLDIIINTINTYSKAIKIEDDILKIKNNKILDNILLNFNNVQFDRNDKDSFFKILHKKTILTNHNTTHPFLILAGISGTGKSRFVRKQAEASLEQFNHDKLEAEQLKESSNFCLVPVRPDWHEPSDLLGYVSRISGTPEFIPTKFTQFLIQSWLHIFKTGGNLQSLGESTAPYWLCLDEMNLAPVEQYFADYLSILESRKWDNNYTCDALIDFASTPTELVQAGYLKQLTIEDQSIVEDPKWEEMWQAFGNKGIPLPPNLIVAGTVNMDETTHGFSRKVLDRALSLDFNEFYKNDLENFFNPQKQAKVLTFSTITHVQQGDLENSVDENGLETIKFVRAINDILTGTPFELAYRALNQALMLVAMWGQKDSSIDEKIHLAAIWDDFLMMKVLPRIEGDDQKLAPKANFVKAQVPKVKDKIGDKEIEEKTSLLTQLYFLLSTNSMLGPIWGKEERDEEHTRPDLHQEKHIKYSGDVELTIPCRSRAKLLWMIQRMERGYTSFWA